MIHNLYWLKYKRALLIYYENMTRAGALGDTKSIILVNYFLLLNIHISI